MPNSDFPQYSHILGGFVPPEWNFREGVYITRNDEKGIEGEMWMEFSFSAVPLKANVLKLVECDNCGREHIPTVRAKTNSNICDHCYVSIVIQK